MKAWIMGSWEDEGIGLVLGKEGGSSNLSLTLFSWDARIRWIYDVGKALGKLILMQDAKWVSSTYMVTTLPS